MAEPSFNPLQTREKVRLSLRNQASRMLHPPPNIGAPPFPPHLASSPSATPHPHAPFPAAAQLAEIAFEKFSAPAFFLSKNAVLTAFASGRGTALVLDVGGGVTSATAVHDGYVLGRPLKRHNLGGDAINEVLLKSWELRNPSQVRWSHRCDLMMCGQLPSSPASRSLRAGAAAAVHAQAHYRRTRRGVRQRGGWRRLSSELRGLVVGWAAHRTAHGLAISRDHR